MPKDDAIANYSQKLFELNHTYHIFDRPDIMSVLNPLIDKNQTIKVNQFLDVLKEFLKSKYKFTKEISHACNIDLNYAATLLQGFKSLLDYNVSVYETQFHFMTQHVDKAEDLAKILIHLHYKETAFYEDVQRKQKLVDKFSQLEIIHTFWLEGSRSYNYVLKQLNKNPMPLILNKKLILSYPSKIFQLNYWTNVLATNEYIFKRFLLLDKEMALHVIESFEILKKNTLFKRTYVNLFLKYPAYALQLAQALAFLKSHNILSQISINFILGHPAEALKRAQDFFEKDYCYVHLDEAILKIPQFLLPQYYQVETILNIGNAFIKKIFHMSLSINFENDIAYTMGLFFLNYTHHKPNRLDKSNLEKLYFISNHHRYIDPDFENTPFNFSEFKTIFEKKCKDFFDTDNVLRKCYNILAVLYEMYDFSLPPFSLKQYDLKEWLFAFETLMHRINKEIKPETTITLQYFMNDLDELADHLKIKNKIDFMTLGLKPFMDFDSKDFVALLWILKLIHLPDYQTSKEKCLKSLQMFLLQTDFGKQSLQGYFSRKQPSKILEFDKKPPFLKYSSVSL